MTVTEYRETHPNCEYCKHGEGALYNCPATRKRMSKRRAKKCPCYTPRRWYSDKEEYEVFRKARDE